MNKYERRTWFERLIELRDQYRSAAETQAVISIDEAIALVAGLDEQAEAETAPTGTRSPRRICP